MLAKLEHCTCIQGRLGIAKQHQYKSTHYECEIRSQGVWKGGAESLRIFQNLWRDAGYAQIGTY